jgi:hypothetical protein
MVAILGTAGRPVSALPPAHATSTDPTTTSTVVGARPATSDDTVQISGRSTMLSRLFANTPESVTYTPANHPRGSYSVFNFLTKADRNTSLPSTTSPTNRASPLKQSTQSLLISDAFERRRLPARPGPVASWSATTRAALPTTAWSTPPTKKPQHSES